MFKGNLTAPFTIEYQESAIPEIKDNEVLLKVLFVGICGSDIQMYHGKHKYMTFPVVIGHELSAEVVKVGKDVTGYSESDLVTVEPQVYCGECYPCRSGRFNVCEKLKVLGVHADGFLAQYAAVDAKYLHHCDKSMDPKECALVEPLAVGVGSVKRAGNYKGAKILVVGAGTIGNMAAQAAKALGADKVMVSDINPLKLDLALKCGVDFAVNVAEKDLKEAILENFGPDKADIIIDAAATRSGFKSILDIARPNSTIVITGNYKEPIEVEIPKIQRQEINLLGHMMYVREDFADAIRFLKEGKITTEGFITAVYPFKKTTDAFKYIDEYPNDFMKLLIDVQNLED
ncbi:MAG: alcohol dehydrogenase catalytic domain-containing protein [Ruminococcaceae bacterium]|nr:alcohol dehydrogenase catalytic domain-containing protein [Oscillospiraceae bacterium]